MTLREFLNNILAVIGTTSLTDEEFETINLGGIAYDVPTYDALAGVVNSRNLVSNTPDRLRWYFLARGVQNLDAVAQGKSNILLGSVL